MMKLTIACEHSELGGCVNNPLPFWRKRKNAFAGRRRRGLRDVVRAPGSWLAGTADPKTRDLPSSRTYRRGSGGISGAAAGTRPSGRLFESRISDTP